MANLNSNLIFVYLPIGLITMLSARMEIQMMARLIGKKSKVILMQPNKPNGKNVLRWKKISIKSIQANSYPFLFLFYSVTMKCWLAPVLKLCQSPINQVTVVTAEWFIVPVLDVLHYTTTFQLTNHLLGYAVWNSSFELGPPSSTGKLISPLLDARTFRCTRISNK